MAASRLDGKRAIITGGASGLGRAACRALAGEGASVMVADLDGDRAAAVAAEITDDGGTAAHAVVDVSQSSSVEAMVEETRQAFGGVDILHTAAGNLRPAMVHKMSEQDFDAVINVHLKGTYLCLRAVINDWIEQRSGKLIAVTSPAGTRGQIGGSNYAAAKAGIIGLVKATALEVAKHNVQINCLLPIAATPMTENVRTDEKLNERFLRNIPMRRWADPEEIAPAVVFLASSDSDYMTGAVLPIDGGRTI